MSDSAAQVLKVVKAVLEADLGGGRSATMRTGEPRASVSAHALKITLLAVATYGQEGRAVMTYKALGALTGLSQAPQWSAISELMRRGLVRKMGVGSWAGGAGTDGGLDAGGRRQRGNRYAVNVEELEGIDLVEAGDLPVRIQDSAADIMGIASAPVVPSVLEKRNLGMALHKVRAEHFQRGPNGQLSIKGARKRRALAEGQGVTLEQIAAALGYSGSSAVSQLLSGARRKAKARAAA